MNEFKIFKNAYIEILFESMFHKMDENSSNTIPTIKKQLYSPKTKNEFKNALKNIIWIYKDDKLDLLYDENIIMEMPGSIDYPGTLCEKIISIKNYESLNVKQILSYINYDWKYYKDLKKYGKPIKIFKFDFSNKEDIDKNFYFPSMNEFIRKKYIENFFNHKNATGAFLSYYDINFFVLNENKEFKYNKKTILHEFTHYLQVVLNVELIDAPKYLDKSKIKFLKLNEDKENDLIDILTDDEEIIPYVNDFCADIDDLFEYQLKNDKIKLDSEYSDKFLKETYIKFLIQSALNNENYLNLDEIKDYKKVNGSLMPLYVVIGCYVYNIELNRIKDILFKENKPKNEIK